MKRWTRHADIFDKTFVIVPINEEWVDESHLTFELMGSMHWYLAVIINPRGILRAPPADVNGTVSESQTGILTRSSATVNRAAVAQSPIPQSATVAELVRTDGPDDEDLDILDMDESTDATARQPNALEALLDDVDDEKENVRPDDRGLIPPLARQQSSSPDPLILGHSELDANPMTNVEQNLANMALGQPLISPTLSAFQAQDARPETRNPSPPPPAKGAREQKPDPVIVGSEE